MPDTAKLTHVVDVEIGRQMFDRLISGNPIAFGFDAINLQVRVKFDAEVISELTPPEDSAVRDGQGGEPTGDPAGGGDDAD